MSCNASPGGSWPFVCTVGYPPCSCLASSPAVVKASSSTVRALRDDDDDEEDEDEEQEEDEEEEEVRWVDRKISGRGGWGVSSTTDAAGTRGFSG